MKIVVNGASRRVSPGVTLADVARDLAGARAAAAGVAAALNGEVVPRLRWAETELTEGDRVEVLVATQGG